MNTSHCTAAPRVRTSNGKTCGHWLHITAARLWSWYLRARQRRELLWLDERLLRDIGITADEARREAAKPFWRE